MVLIPAYRCEKQIGRVLGQIDPETARKLAEVLVVENRSPDIIPWMRLCAVEDILQSSENKKIALSLII